VHETDHQTSLYVWVWSSPAHLQINGRGTTPKRATQAACSCRFDNLTVHHAYFEHHGLQPPPPSSPVFPPSTTPQEANTTTNRPPTDHQEPPSVSLSSLQPLPRVFFLLLLPLPPATISVTASATVSTTNRPPRSHCDSLPLLLPASLSPLQTSSSCAVATPAAKLSINAATSLSTSTTTGPHRLRWFSIPALHQPPAPVAHCCCRCMQNSFCMQRPK